MHCAVYAGVAIRLDVPPRVFRLSSGGTFRLWHPASATGILSEPPNPPHPNCEVFVIRAVIPFLLLTVSPLPAQQPAPLQPPLERLKSDIERITRSVDASWGVY